MKLGDCHLDLQAQLLRRADGTPADLRPQAWGVLRLLAATPGRLVTKDQFMDAIWRDVVVTEGSLAQAVSDLRAALGPEGHRIVRTVARRGYLLAVAEDGEALPAPLPAPRALFGREDDLRRLAEKLAAARLVTVVGAGGIGKTALALEAAHRAGAEGRRVAWVDLAPVGEAAWLPAALARALDLPLAQKADPLPALCAALRPLQALVVLDNAEHVVEAAAALVRTALDAAPGLAFLCTSQAPLRVEGERLFRLGGLEGSARESPPVALFIDQVQAADHRFEPGPAEVAAIAHICRRLDGVPLAIRLAAARTQGLGLATLEARLDERLAMLSGERRDAPERQHTLQAALDWSCGLLGSAEQRLFRRLSVFAGGFTLRLAAAAVGDGSGEWRLLDALQVLAERSLTERDEGEPPRWHLLETMRVYGQQQLREHGETDAALAGLAKAVDEALAADMPLMWSRPRDWVERWTPELANLRIALDWSATREPARFVTVASGAMPLFVHLDLGLELFQRMRRIERTAIDAVAPGPRALWWLACAYLTGGASTSLCLAYSQEAERAAREAADPMALYVALGMRLGTLGVPPAEAPPLLREMQSLEQPSWPARLRASGRLGEVAVHLVERRWGPALQAAETGFALAHESQSATAMPLFANWILVASHQHRGSAATLQRAEALAPLLQGAPVSMSIPFECSHAWCLLRLGDLVAAKQKLAAMFARCRTVGWQSFDYFGDLYAELALVEGRLEAAARLLGHADAAQRRAWVAAPVPETHETLVATLRSALDADTLERLRAEGATLDPEAVVRLTLGDGYESRS